MKLEGCEFPEDLLYYPEELVWAMVNPEGTLVVGLTSTYSALAGRLSNVRFTRVGEVVTIGSKLASIESPRFFGLVRSPVNGVVVESNAQVLASPRLANDSPYQLGWIAKVMPGDGWRLESPLTDFKTASTKLAEKVKELKVRCFAAVADYEIFDIGVECSATITHLDEVVGKASPGEKVHLVTDDPTADVEIQRWQVDTGQRLLEARREGSLFHYIVEKVK